MDTQTSITALKTANGVAISNLMGIGGITGTTRSLATMAEGLVELRANPDPSYSKETQDRNYLKKFTQETQKAEGLITRERERLDMGIVGLYGAAREKAGIKVPHNASEIRQALLKLDVKARDAALSAAVKGGYGDVLGAIEGQPSWLYGGATRPVGSLIEDALEVASPGYRGTREKYDEAHRNLNLCEKHFTSASEGLRNPLGEQKAQQASERHQSAMQKLGEAAA